MRVSIHTETHIPISTQRSQHTVRHRLTTSKVQVRRIRNRSRWRRTRIHSHKTVPILVLTLNNSHVHRNSTNTRRRQTRRHTLHRRRTSNLQTQHRHTRRRRRTKTTTRHTRIHQTLRRIKCNDAEGRFNRQRSAIAASRCCSQGRNGMRSTRDICRNRHRNGNGALCICLHRVQHLRR